VSEVQIKDRYLAQLYREAYARHQEGERLGMEQHRREVAWPSTGGRNTVEGERGAVSKLGGVAKPAESKGPR
jgi:hypothetical protein